jgi:peptidoglycan hydrolase-like protein with peptidoglycan-binding domain
MSLALFLAAALASTSACGPADEELVSDEQGEGQAVDALSATTPVPGHRITTPFGVRGDHWAAGYHTGDDYAAPIGARVVATRGGRVVGAGWNILGAAYGRQVIIETDGIRHLYAHLSRISVSAGQRVARGEKLGEVGDTGNTTGPHLHYEERHSPYTYWDHRKPRFNRSGTTSSGRGYKNWIFETKHRDNLFLRRALLRTPCDDGFSRESEYYGEGLRRAVACFQRRQGWSGSGANGIMGPLTAERLYLVGDVQVSKLHFGVTRSNSVRMLQQRLNEVRRAGLDITGNYDKATRAAVAAWQRSIGDSGVGADGNMGPLQAERLFPNHRYRVR